MNFPAEARSYCRETNSRTRSAEAATLKSRPCRSRTTATFSRISAADSGVAETWSFQPWSGRSPSAGDTRHHRSSRAIRHTWPAALRSRTKGASTDSGSKGRTVRSARGEPPATRSRLPDVTPRPPRSSFPTCRALLRSSPSCEVGKPCPHAKKRQIGGAGSALYQKRPMPLQLPNSVERLPYCRVLPEAGRAHTAVRRRPPGRRGGAQTARQAPRRLPPPGHGHLLRVDGRSDEDVRASPRRRRLRRVPHLVADLRLRSRRCPRGAPAGTRPVSRAPGGLSGGPRPRRRPAAGHRPGRTPGVRSGGPTGVLR